MTNKFLNLSPEDAAKSPVHVPLLFISFPSTKDPTYNDRFPGKSTCGIVTVAPFEWFEEWKEERVMHRGEDHESLKQAIGEQMWHQVLDMFPQLEGKREYFDVGTPLSNQFYLNSLQGEVYGLDYDVGRFDLGVVSELRPETDIPGLFLTGQDVPVCGFSGAMFGGLLCASAVLKRNVISDILKLKERTKKKKD